jgi:long-chain acyl-CoA synthetase
MTDSTLDRNDLPANWPAMSMDEVYQRIGAVGAFTEIDEVELRGIRTKVWKNAPPTLRDNVLHSRSFGSREFLVQEGERATYEAFYRATAQLAHALIDAGAVKGDRIVLAMRNLPEWVVAFYAAASIGAIVTPLNAWLLGAELQQGLVDSGAKIAVMDIERFDRLADRLDHCPDLKRIFVTRASGEPGHPNASRLEDVIGATNDWIKLPDQDLPTVDLGPEDDATIFYTSGTTGKPKGALSTHRSFNCNIVTAAAARARTALRRGEEPQPPDPNAPQPVALIAVPLFHVTGCMVILNSTMFGGGKLVMMYKWDPVRAFELIEREKVTTAGGVPTIAWQLLEHPSRVGFDLSSLQNIVYGGGPASPELVRRIRDVFPHVLPGQGYGMTETSAAVSSNDADDYLLRPESVGPATPVAKFEVRDLADGKSVVPTGQLGELWIFGPMTCRGYWNNAEATARTFVDGWVRTGDIARIDHEGFCYIVDRAKDMIIRGGENIYCVEVENALYDHPDVVDAAVVSRPHRTLGEEPAAVVNLKPGATVTNDELRAFVASRLPPFKVPVEIRILPGILPRTQTGKIMKSELRKLFDAESVRAH